MLTITNFPELVDSVEQTPMYPSYKKDNMNLYISLLFVRLSAIAQAFGMFFGSFTAEYIGYTYSFVAAGLFIWIFTIIYASVCGMGEVEDKPIPGEDQLHRDDPEKVNLLSNEFNNEPQIIQKGSVEL